MSYPLFRNIFVLLCGAVAAAWGTPRLALDNTVATGRVAPQSNGIATRVVVFNAGDGTLNLTFSSEAPWLSAQTQAGCPGYNHTGECYLINIVVDATTLASKWYTAALTVGSPGALDAPQDVIVSVFAGGVSAIPDRITLNPSRSGSDSQTIFTGPASGSISVTEAPAGGLALTVGASSFGTLFWISEYTVQVAAPPGATEGLYHGTVQTSGFPSAADNKTVQVRIVVSPLPMAVPQGDGQPVYFRVPSGSGPQSSSIEIFNGGAGTLVLSPPTSDSDWLSAALADSTTVTVMVDPSSLPPGYYTGSITVPNNGVRSVVVPVTLDVGDVVLPWVYHVSTVNPAFPPVVAPGEVVQLSGTNLSAHGPFAADASRSLPTTLIGTRLLIGGMPAPLFSVSLDTIQFQVPYEVNPGSTTLQVERDGELGNSVPLSVVAHNPSLFAVLDSAGNRIDTRFTQNVATVTPNTTFTLLGYGFGVTTPAPASGMPTPAQSIFGGAPFDVPIVLGIWSGTLGAYQFAEQTVTAELVPGMIGVYSITTTVPQPQGATPAAVWFTVYSDEEGWSPLIAVRVQ